MIHNSPIPETIGHVTNDFRVKDHLDNSFVSFSIIDSVKNNSVTFDNRVNLSWLNYVIERVNSFGVTQKYRSDKTIHIDANGSTLLLNFGLYPTVAWIDKVLVEEEHYVHGEAYERNNLGFHYFLSENGQAAIQSAKDCGDLQPQVLKSRTLYLVDGSTLHQANPDFGDLDEGERIIGYAFNVEGKYERQTGLPWLQVDS